MLVAATGRPVEAMTSSTTGTSIGAALLARMKAGKQPSDKHPVSSASRFSGYAQRWREAVGG
jgi:patatin-like phospholipase/acyl hydrolase